MSFAYLPLYTGDYLRDTQHLSCSEHGIYLKFLMHCWDQKGPIPLDERKQSGIANARSGDEVEAMRRVRDEFFVQMDDGFYNERMQKEIERAENISGNRSTAGKKGYQARAKQLLNKSQASASIPTPSPILSPALPSKRSNPLAPRVNTLSLGDGAISEKIPVVGGAEFEIRHSYAAELERLFPAVDVPQTLREIRAWNIANPERRKTPRGVAKHITNWMQKVQNG